MRVVISKFCTAPLASLATFPRRGRGHEGPRELVVPFGRGPYVVRYRVFDDVVVITRVSHGRERR